MLQPYDEEDAHATAQYTQESAIRKATVSAQIEFGNSHARTPFTAFGDLTDNAKDARASRLDIELAQSNCGESR
jgi:hypothetical protein